ncbi:MAG TPA: PPC domain-containing protein, partial [Gemmatimonadaceae bacterium]|nr:PPC domain-containing protein [Gemmatimonadaceae bacterium]
TVTGESIDSFGDLDQFTFSGTAGQKIVVEFATPQGVYEDATHLGGTLVLQVLAPDGTALGQISSGNPTPLTAQTTGTLTLPSTGQYTISVSGGNNGQGGFGAYVFATLPSS